MFIKCVHVFHADSIKFSDSVNYECQLLSQQYPGCSITVQYSTTPVNNLKTSNVIFSALIIASE